MNTEKQFTATYFSIHSLNAMSAGSFSIILGNCPNKPCSRLLASELYPESDFYIEYHFSKYDMSPVINNY